MQDESVITILVDSCFRTFASHMTRYKPLKIKALTIQFPKFGGDALAQRV